MKQLKLRYARPEESGQITDWLNTNPLNQWDPEILKYPTLQVLCAYDGQGPVAYLPTQRVLVMESIALRPNLDRLNAAQALRDLTKACELIADGQGIREVVFLGGHGGVGDMAASPNGHSFAELPFKVFRNKLG